LNLSQHKSLRELRLVAKSIPIYQNLALALEEFNILFSIIPSSSQLDIVIIYKGDEFSPNCATPPPGHAGYVGKSIAKRSCACDMCLINLVRLKMLGEAYRNRKFRLVFCVEAPEEKAWYTMRALELQVGALQDGKLHSLLSELSIVSTVPCFDDKNFPFSTWSTVEIAESIGYDWRRRVFAGH
jgi:hypothetical protein